MKEKNYITKDRKLSKEQDYGALFTEGLSLIQDLSGNNWTDYNAHDPGITILEVLCYAITELGYKTAYDIKDLLVEREDEAFKNEFQFFTARHILTNNPVTFNDFRKLLIDVDGIKNAWLKLEENPKPDIWIDCKESKLIFEKDNKPELNHLLEEVNISGLYNIILEFDKDNEDGDLNEIFQEVKIKTASEELTILVDLPGWASFFAQKISSDDILNFKFTSVTEVNRNLYNGKMKVTLADRTFTLHVKIHSTKKSTPERNALITSEMLKTGAGSIVDNYLKKLKKALPIAEKAFKTLHANRNLCEDFNSFLDLEVERVSVCADIEVTAEADNEQVLAEVYYQIERFIDPRVSFYSLDELLDKGKPTEEIFEGPALNHGFIDEQELINSEPRTVIYTSDLVQIMMDVEGVVAVKNIVLASRHKAELLNDGQAWCLKIKPGLIPRFERQRSKFVLYKENLPYFAVKQEVEAFLKEFYALERKQKLSKDEVYDLLIPKGIDKMVEKYFTIQNDFPLTYGIGEKGIPGIITDKRQAQAKQLKAYLIFFDQLLANYLAQLSRVKALFSFSSKVDRTYFYKILYNLPEAFTFPTENKGSSLLFNDEQLPLIYHLIKDFTTKLNLPANPNIDLDNFETFKTQWTEYKKKSGFENPNDVHFIKNLDGITEDLDTFHDRRNRFLDHVMGRFAEQFSDYTLLMYHINKKKAASELIDDKTAFLADYPTISSERGKAFDYKNEAEIWNTNNVAGLKKRLSRLLGIDNYTRKHLYCQPIDDYFEIFKDTTGEWRFRFNNNEGKIVLQSEGYTAKQMCKKGIASVKLHGQELKFYFPKPSVDGRFYFNIKSNNGEIVATSVLYTNKTLRDRAIQELISIFKGECNVEGFHLVEHLLLRPYTDNDKLMEVCVDEDCNSCPGNIDPYSFRITLIVPYWPSRFDNMAFRRFFEKTVRLETPAHIHAKICWADEKDIIAFENAYKDWLAENAKRLPDQAFLTLKLKKLIEVMNEIRSVYPVTTLHDCLDGGEENAVVLNNSTLGTFNPEKNGND